MNQSPSKASLAQALPKPQHHAGDCSFYDAHARICTCGLLDRLRFLGEDLAQQLYARYSADALVHADQLGKLRRLVECSGDHGSWIDSR
jgi:hypothetical protein